MSNSDYEIVYASSQETTHGSFIHCYVSGKTLGAGASETKG